MNILDWVTEISQASFSLSLNEGMDQQRSYFEDRALSTLL